MSSLVLDLQQEVLKPDCDILNALRKAHLIAAKLRLNEFDAWIQLELNGYDLKEKDSIPEYRKVKGTLKAFNPYNGWIPAQCPDDELEKMICVQKLWQSVGELQELYSQSSTGVFIYQFPAGQMEALSSLFDTPVPMQFALHISTHLLKTIIEKVKNCVLEWTIRLEAEGIVGEKADILNVNFIIDGITTVMQVKMVYEVSKGDEIKNIHYEINLSNGLIISDSSDDAEFAVHNLRKILPSNINIACCQSCRHGKFCPYGNCYNEIYCLKEMTYNNKLDVVNIFLENQNVIKQRKRKFLDACIDFEPITDNFYTYNDWGIY